MTTVPKSARLTAIILVLAGCYRSLSTLYAPPLTQLDAASTYAVVRGETDYRDVGTIVCEELAKRGMSASLIYEPGGSAQYDVLVRYESSWRWDVTWYLLALSIGFYDSNTDELLSGATIYRTSLIRESPQQAVSFLVDQVLGAYEQAEVPVNGACDDDHS